MNKVLWLVSFAAVLALSPKVVGDDGKLPTPPLEPLVKDAPAYSTWTIVYTADQTPSGNSPSGKPGARAIQQIVVTKAGDTIREVKTWSDGLTSERWSIQGYTLMNQPGAPDIYVLRSGQPLGSASPTGSASSDFPELFWISPANFKETTSYEGHACYRFQITLNFPSAPVVQAWIDGETGLPLAVDDGTATQKYSFENSSSRQLELPPAFAQALARYSKIIGVPVAQP